MRVAVHDPETMEALAVVDVPNSHLIAAEMNLRPPYFQVTVPHATGETAPIRFLSLFNQGKTHWIAVAETATLLARLHQAARRGQCPLLEESYPHPTFSADIGRARQADPHDGTADAGLPAQ